MERITNPPSQLEAVQQDGVLKLSTCFLQGFSGTEHPGPGHTAPCRGLSVHYQTISSIPLDARSTLSPSQSDVPWGQKWGPTPVRGAQRRSQRGCTLNKHPCPQYPQSRGFSWTQRGVAGVGGPPPRPHTNPASALPLSIPPPRIQIHLCSLCLLSTPTHERPPPPGCWVRPCHLVSGVSLGVTGSGFPRACRFPLYVLSNQVEAPQCVPGIHYLRMRCLVQF